MSAQFTDLMEAGLDGPMVSLVPTTCKVEEEQTQLMNLIGQLLEIAHVIAWF